MILFKDISKKYSNGNVALHDINVKIEKNEFVFLVGASGAGKSTFVKLLTKELDPTSGKIYLDGEDVTKIHKRLLPYYRRQIGPVFQDFKLLNSQTVYENVAFALRIIGRPNREIKREVPLLLNLVGLENKMKRKPLELSGGEQQRVAIARALAGKPKLLLCDEPTGNLDPETSWELVDLLNKLSNYGTTILMATHDFTVVDNMQKRVIELKDGSIVRDSMGGYHEIS